ncbi:MFS transporter, partial [Deinococcus pimensis]|uniref:MFS transporter n=1 Tax=Deinococcus pimensis TaxID=309888 RepID=UPI0012FB50FC
GERRESTLDALSVPLAALGFGGLVYGLSTIGTPAGLAGAAWPLGLGVVALALFTWRQLRLARRDAALLDLRAFRFPAFTLGVLLMMIAMTALFGGAILLPLYFQTIRGLDTLQTGLLLLPGGLVMGLLAPLVGRLFDRVGPLPLVVPGAVLMTAVLWAFGGIDARTPVWLLLGLHLVLSVGLALLFTPVFTSTLAPLPARLHSHGSAILSTAQQVAGAVGTALLVTVMTARTAALTRGGASPVAAQTAGLQAAFVLAAVIAVLAVLLALLQRRSTAGPGLHEDGALNAAD